MKKLLKRICDLILRSDMKILPGNIAFFLVLSIIPIITLIGFISSTFSIPLTTLTDFMNNYFPREISAILVPYFSGQGVSLNVIIFTIMGFVLASNGSSVIIIASNKLYKIDDSNYLKRKLKSLNLIFLLVLLILFMLVFMAFGNKIVLFLTDNFFSGFEKYIYYLYLIIKWPIGFIFIFLIVKLIYTIAPDKRIPSKSVNKGAIFTTIFWILTTYIYGYYVTYIADYTLFYGNLSSIIILILWVYFISYILVIGIIINVSHYELSKNGDKEKEKG